VDTPIRPPPDLNQGENKMTQFEGEIKLIRRELIKAGDNDRTVFDQKALKELAESIRQDGLAQPITVRPILDGEKRYEIVAGERRFRACTLLEMEEIPAIVRELSDDQAASIMLLENLQRVDLNPMEEARAYQKRMQAGWTPKELTEQTKIAPNRIASRLGLLKLIPAAQKLVADGQLPLKFAQLLGPASGEALDNNRQHIALAFLNQRENPSVSEFKILLAELWEEQRQESGALFDLKAFVEQANQGKLKTRFERTWQADDSLPIMPRRQSVSAAFQEYMSTLEQNGRIVEAGVVGRILESMILTGWVAPPQQKENKETMAA
ncbi:MAG: ParB/RepB/Spo0J family partition protein, partial [Leptolinea sp.]